MKKKSCSDVIAYNYKMNNKETEKAQGSAEPREAKLILYKSEMIPKDFSGCESDCVLGIRADQC